MNRALWVVQAFPLDALTKQVALPGWFLRFTGTAEVLGALGLILPGLLRIRPDLTPLAAAGLSVVMIGATVLTLATGGGFSVLIPATVGLLAVFVVYGRSSTSAPEPARLDPGLAGPR